MCQQSKSTAVELICNRCGNPVGDVWYMTNSYEIVCIPCWKKGEGKVAS